ncbi:MAG TPA: FtsX-like permease family protein, partial [Bacillota bacterium]|nr:FtsX-like permease family protein [Bacillota bacterium]
YVNDGYDIDQVIQEMKVDSNFSGYSIFPTLDWDYINNKAMDLVAMLLALGLIVMMAVVMVLDSLFPIVNINLRQQLGVTKTLGANSKFIWHVNLIQWLIYTIISFLIGMGLSLFIINYGIHVYGFDGYIPLKLLTIVLAFTIVSTFIVLRALISFHRENRQSIASQSKNRRFNRLKIKYPLVALALVVLAVELIFKPFGLAIHSLIIVITSIYLALNLSSVILVYMSEWIGKARKKSLFSIFQLKYLRTNMHIQQSLRVVVISLLAVVLIFAVRTFMFNEIDNFYDAVRFDLAIVNVYDYDDALMDEIETYDITYAQDAIFYRDIEINFSEDDLETCRFFVSMDYENLNQFFNFDYDIQSIDPSYISDETPYVILPINFQLIHQVNIGDTITLDLNAKLEDISVVIAGFIDTNFDNILYSNIIHVGAYENVA